jgi:FkbM family methyltransferase
VRWLAEHGVSNVTQICATHFGFKMETDKVDSVKWYVYFFNVFEPTISKAWKNILKPGDVVIDIGANVGYHSLLASTCVGPEGKVIAFEPSPKTFAQIKSNLALNDGNVVEPRQLAVSNRSGEVVLHLAQEGLQGQSSIVFSEGRANSVVVKCALLGDAIDERLLSRVALIKIDVEGAEKLVIEGLISLLPKLREDCVFFVEATPAPGGSIAEIIAPLVDAGFRPFVLENVYSPVFYLTDPAPVAVPYDGRSAPMLDLVLSRSEDLPARCRGRSK